MSQTRRFSGLAMAALALSPALAAAQTVDKSAAVALFDEAERLSAAGNFKDACPKFAASNRLDPQLGALMHLADCYEKAGQLASAWASFRDAVEIASARGDSRADYATSRAAALEPRLSRLTVAVVPEAVVRGLEVRRDGVVITPGIWGSSIPVDIGEHIIEAQAPGKKDWKGSITVSAEGSTQTISVPPLTDVAVATEAGPAPASGPDKAAPAAPANSGGTQRLIGWSVVGAGAIGLVVGTVFEIQRGAKLKDRDAICPTGKGCTPDEAASISDLTSQARSASTIGTVGLIAGGVLVAGGLGLVFTAPHSTEKVAVVPALGPSFQGVIVRSALW